MIIQSANQKNLDSIIPWVTNAEECRLWGGPAISFPIKKETLIEEIKFCPENSYVGNKGNLICAFGQIIRDSSGISHMARIITNPEYRGQGFGREFCTKLPSFSFGLNSKAVSLSVYRNNLPALNLYISLGFIEISERSDENYAFMLKT